MLRSDESIRILNFGLSKDIQKETYSASVICKIRNIANFLGNNLNLLLTSGHYEPVWTLL